jgi:hypothetical protein
MIYLTLLMTVPGLFDHAALNAAPEISGQYRYDRYLVISQQNMFSRNRRSAQATSEAAAQAPKQSVLLSLYVLKGVAVNRSVKVAFVEEEVSGESFRAQIGARIMDGVIKDIQFGYVTVDQNGLTKVIRVGESFGKTETLTDIPADQIEQEHSQEETDEEDSSMSEESDILKKLMERRQSELGT